MKKKEIKFHEVEIKFLVRKGSYEATDAATLRANIEREIGHTGYEQEDLEIKIDGK